MVGWLKLIGFKKNSTHWSCKGHRGTCSEHSWNLDWTISLTLPYKGLGWLFLAASECFLYETSDHELSHELGMWIHHDKYSIYSWIHNRNLSYDSFEFITMNSYAIFHYWIQYGEICMNSEYWILLDFQ